MIKLITVDNCVGCPQGCIHCGKWHEQEVEALICDSCGEECDELYDDSDDSGDQLCKECLLKGYKVIDWDNAYDFADERMAV